MSEVLQQRILGNDPLTEEEVRVENVNALATFVRSRSMTERRALVEAVNRRLQGDVSPQIRAGLELLRNGIELSRAEGALLTGGQAASAVGQWGAEQVGIAGRGTARTWEAYRGLFADSPGGRVASFALAGAAGLFVLGSVGRWLSQPGEGWFRKTLKFLGIAALGVGMMNIVGRFTPSPSPSGAPATTAPSGPEVASPGPLGMPRRAMVGDSVGGTVDPANQAADLTITLNGSTTTVRPDTAEDIPAFSVSRESNIVTFVPRVPGIFTLTIGGQTQQIEVSAPPLTIEETGRVGQPIIGTVNSANLSNNLTVSFNANPPVNVGVDQATPADIREFSVSREADTVTFTPNVPGRFTLMIGGQTRTIVVTQVPL